MAIAVHRGDAMTYLEGDDRTVHALMKKAKGDAVQAKACIAVAEAVREDGDGNGSDKGGDHE